MSNSSINPTWPASGMRQWRDFHGLSLEEMSERLKALGVKRFRSAPWLDRIERGLGPWTVGIQRVVDGYAEVFNCFDRELDLPPARGSVSAWFGALAPQQRQIVKAFLCGVERRERRIAIDNGDVPVMSLTGDAVQITGLTECERELMDDFVRALPARRRRLAGLPVC